MSTPAPYVPTLLEGNPFPSPLSLFIFQVFFIVSLSRGLAWLFAKIKQPAVIAEMIGGILLGPTALGRIPGFTATVFPPASVKIIQVCSQFGLVIFMFLVGLEMNAKDFRDNAKKIVTIAGIGVVVPLVFAVPLALPFNSPEFSDTSLPNLILFIGVCIGMSALPVLARILSDRGLLSSDLGNLVMGATSADDVMAWCLLAIVVAVVRSTDYLGILWTFLLTLGECLLVAFVFRKLLHRVLRDVKTQEDLNAKLFFGVFAILLVVAWITETIGLSGLIGAFQVGLAMPREGPAIQMMLEKLEDFIVVIIMPLFFTNSGLRTNFALISTGKEWGLTILLVAVATLSKVVGVGIPAKCFGLGWRQSIAFGVLMSCKGLVALIVVNFGIDYDVITPKLFSCLVMMVVVTSFLTVPLTDLVLPMRLFKQMGPQDVETGGNIGDNLDGGSFSEGHVVDEVGPGTGDVNSSFRIGTPESSAYSECPEREAPTDTESQSRIFLPDFDTNEMHAAGHHHHHPAHQAHHQHSTTDTSLTHHVSEQSLVAARLPEAPTSRARTATIDKPPESPKARPRTATIEKPPGDRNRAGSIRQSRESKRVSVSLSLNSDAMHQALAEGGVNDSSLSTLPPPPPPATSSHAPPDTSA